MIATMATKEETSLWDSVVLAVAVVDTRSLLTPGHAGFELAGPLFIGRDQQCHGRFDEGGFVPAE
jgi:hypothetical protein